MHNCVKFVELRGTNSALNLRVRRGVGKPHDLATVFAWFINGFFHSKIMVFKSVSRRVLPISHTPYYNYYDYLLNINYCCRRLV